MNWYQEYDFMLSLFQTDKLIDETEFYFRSDLEKSEHYIGCHPQYEKLYWAEYCDVPDGCEFETARELFEAKIYDGKSIKDRWSELVLICIGGISVVDWEKYCLRSHTYHTAGKAETPFGDFHVWANGKQIPFSLRISSYVDDKNTPDNPACCLLGEQGRL